MKIEVIAPLLYNENFEKSTIQEFSAHARKDTKVHVSFIEKGTASIESMYDEYLAAPGILEKVKDAQEKKFDAIIIDCMGDPAVDAARELVNIPVIGPCQASMAFASSIGEKFSVVTVLNRVIPMLNRLAKVYGYTEKLASVKSIEIPVLDLEE
jgi:allantoin racemase